MLIRQKVLDPIERKLKEEAVESLDQIVLLKGRIAELTEREKAGILRSEDYTIESNKLRHSATGIINSLKLENLSDLSDKILKGLVLTHSNSQKENLENYLNREFKMEGVEFKVKVKKEEMAEDKIRTTVKGHTLKPRSLMGYDFLIFDGSDFPVSNPWEDDDYYLPDGKQIKRLNLLKHYLDILNEFSLDSYTEIPVLFFGPQQKELYDYMKIFIGANSWITLNGRIKELLEYLKKTRGIFNK